MPNIHELIDNIALKLSNQMSSEGWFTSLDLRNEYCQLKSCKNKSERRNFSIVGGESRCNCCFTNGFYSLGDMANKIQC